MITSTLQSGFGNQWNFTNTASIPMLNRAGEYVGTMTEGDILWGIKKLIRILNLKEAEDNCNHEDCPRRADYEAGIGRCRYGGSDGKSDGSELCSGRG